MVEFYGYGFQFGRPFLILLPSERFQHGELTPFSKKTAKAGQGFIPPEVLAVLHQVRAGLGRCRCS